MKWRALAWLPFAFVVAACDQSVSTKSVLGNYDIMISQDGKTDSGIVMTISLGSNSSLLLTFTQGITTDADGPNADGLRASLGDGNALTIAKQPAHIDHAQGLLDGTIYGEGKITAGMLTLTLHYLPTNFAIGQTTDADGGIILSRADMALGLTLDYAVTGTKE